MWILVHQYPAKGEKDFVCNWVNMDMVERVHPRSPSGQGLFLHLQSGQMIEVQEDMDWWKNQIDVSKDQR